ncbi:hypothetical protein LPB136_05285 [Tenacibaculum todarodis]|uniref:DUF998 domain-containing protein n=1 Tax=Tenacibaculum todarodis TaxID=1850252 RepID=A0A1L3JI63_9FLAO|nr:hypothetical protein [Tenacibaculum todarodis]APG64809.1 hypothetical protein LPB136_05285 [Tenacibaculum todarodis]
MKKSDEKNNQIISYLTLRKLIGIIGVGLPIILPIVLLVNGNNILIQDSISAYYATEARDFFVGFLFVLGFFLLTYTGYSDESKPEKINDNVVANIGAIFAICVAIFPNSSQSETIQTIHFLSAVALFSVFAYFSLVIFKKTNPAIKPTEMKLKRNKVYTICGIIIIVFVLLAGISFKFLSDETRASTNIIFWCEVIALIAFGISWLTKGETFLEDKN